MSWEEDIKLLLEEEKRHNRAKEKSDKIRNIILFFILIVLIISLFHCPCPNAPTHVKGYELDKYVKDQNEDPLIGATVILYNHPNGMVVAQGVTDENGWCNFTNLQYRRYFLWVSYGGITSSEWVWLKEDINITNTLTLPTEGLGAWAIRTGGIK